MKVLMKMRNVKEITAIDLRFDQWLVTLSEYDYSLPEFYRLI